MITKNSWARLFPSTSSKFLHQPWTAKRQWKFSSSCTYSMHEECVRKTLNVNDLATIVLPHLQYTRYCCCTFVGRREQCVIHACCPCVCVAENSFSVPQNSIVFVCCACILCSLLDSPICLLLDCMQCCVVLNTSNDCRQLRHIWSFEPDSQQCASGLPFEPLLSEPSDDKRVLLACTCKLRKSRLKSAYEKCVLHLRPFRVREGKSPESHCACAWRLQKWRQASRSCQGFPLVFI